LRKELRRFRASGADQDPLARIGGRRTLARHASRSSGGSIMRTSLALLLATVLFASAARAQAPCHAENDGNNFNDLVSMGGVMVGIRFVAPANLTVDRIEVFTGEVAATHDLGLWSHDGIANEPNAPLSTGSFPVNFANGWQGAQLAAPVALTAATTYWMVWTPTGGGQASVDVPMGSLGQVYRGSFDNGQTWNGPFQFNDRHWKFRLYCNGSQAPVVYCTAGTTTNGCVASISASGNPNVSHSQPCQVSVANVEGQKTGILFYGLGTQGQSWCSVGGGTSFLCVKAPTSRTGVQSSGGTVLACDGTLSLDWNAFQLATPGALGQPWSAGSQAYVQAWFRDPPACKTTSLSDGVELTYQP
jgi:hypothetical protein